MKRFFVFVLFLMFSFSFVSATTCDDFCIDKGYLYGSCRETTEKQGFCAGKTEDVYGFSQCTDYDRCCCGNDASNIPTEEEENTSDSITGEVVSSTPSSGDSSTMSAQSLFWPLVVVVGLLAVGVWIKKKAFRSEGKKEDTEEIKDL